MKWCLVHQQVCKPGRSGCSHIEVRCPNCVGLRRRIELLRDSITKALAKMKSRKGKEARKILKGAIK